MFRPHKSWHIIFVVLCLHNRNVFRREKVRKISWGTKSKVVSCRKMNRDGETRINVKPADTIAKDSRVHANEFFRCIDANRHYICILRACDIAYIFIKSFGQATPVQNQGRSSSPIFSASHLNFANHSWMRSIRSHLQERNV